MEPRWVDDAAALAEPDRRARATSRATRSTPSSTASARYWPRLALVQVAWPGGIALIDPFAVDMAPFGEILRGPGVMVAHAAEQDLAILVRACGQPPTQLFDTQVAAGLHRHGRAVARVARRAAARRAARQGRPPHRLDAPAAARRAADLRRGRRRVSARAARRARRAPRTDGPPRMGDRRVRGAPRSASAPGPSPSSRGGA